MMGPPIGKAFEVTVPNAAHLHLLINHLPVEGAVLAALVLAAGLLTRWTSARPVGLALAVFAALTALPAYLTGDPAAHMMSPTPGWERALVNEHEDAAVWAAVTLGIAGVAALLTLWSGRGGRTAPRWMAPLTLALTVFACVVLARTAQLGGDIRHPEIRSGYTPPARGAAPAP